MLKTRKQRRSMEEVGESKSEGELTRNAEDTKAWKKSGKARAVRRGMKGKAREFKGGKVVGKGGNMKKRKLNQKNGARIEAGFRLVYVLAY
eukprot:925034-Pleurochrysis_carterae.AAC.1